MFLSRRSAGERLVRAERRGGLDDDVSWIALQPGQQGARRRRITVWLVVPPGDVRPHIAVTETPGAVVVGGQVTPARADPARADPDARRLYRAAITLAALGGRRVLLDASTGLPVAVAPR